LPGLKKLQKFTELAGRRRRRQQHKHGGDRGKEMSLHDETFPLWSTWSTGKPSSPWVPRLLVKTANEALGNLND
jgi:hypothetical protein